MSPLAFRFFTVGRGEARTVLASGGAVDALFGLRLEPTVDARALADAAEREMLARFLASREPRR